MYWIAPYDMVPFEVYCEMTTDGGVGLCFQPYDNSGQVIRSRSYGGWRNRLADIP